MGHLGCLPFVKKKSGKFQGLRRGYNTIAVMELPNKDLIDSAYVLMTEEISAVDVIISFTQRNLNWIQEHCERTIPKYMPREVSISFCE